MAGWGGQYSRPGRHTMLSHDGMEAPTGAKTIPIDETNEWIIQWPAHAHNSHLKRKIDDDVAGRRREFIRLEFQRFARFSPASEYERRRYRVPTRSGKFSSSFLSNTGVSSSCTKVQCTSKKAHFKCWTKLYKITHRYEHKLNQNFLRRPIHEANSEVAILRSMPTPRENRQLKRC